MEIIFFWLILSIVAGVIASGKGRSGLGFFLLSIVLSPLIGIICALAAGRNERALERGLVNSGDMRKCPSCAELVRQEAVKCRFCGEALPPGEHPDPVYRFFKSIGSAIHYPSKPP